ncbi:MAG TPA: aminotransferase class V-fold PLP-dependent enzyme [Armatimonadota bacterium]|jgi:cysteine desulfurase
MIYLDHAATTPVDSAVLDEMLPYFREAYGNPSSLHSAGQEAKFALDNARDRVAALLHARPSEIIFTSGGTEADNLALRGVAGQAPPDRRRLIVSSVEHEAILETAAALEAQGWVVARLPVDDQGIVHPESLRDAMRRGTALVSVMAANNEVGAMQPIAELAQIAHAGGALFHTDAVQAVGAMDVSPSAWGVDLLSLSGHKIYGPKGIGALWVRGGLRVAPQVTGGGQERERRSGTENVPAIVGLGKACELAGERIAAGEPERLRQLRDILIRGVLETVPAAILTGHPTERLPNHASFCFPGVEGEPILLNLDFAGIAASSGSACSTGAIEPSHVLLAMGFAREIANGALRLTLGRANTEDDVAAVLAVLPGIVNRLRSLG